MAHANGAADWDIEQWPANGVSLDLNVDCGTPKRISATQYTVEITAKWRTHWDTPTNYGMKVTSGGVTKSLNPDDNKSQGSSITFTGTYSIGNYGAATRTILITFENYNDYHNDSATKTITVSVDVPAWTSYTIKYDANGGSGAPSAQTKYHGVNLTISSTKPIRAGYVFAGWSLTKGGSVYYTPGSSCGKNENLTLYAVWTANTFTVTYNANGGSGAPSAQTKTYGVDLTLSSTKPTRTNYTFKGWGTSASSTTVAYSAGGKYTNNASVTLYAIWTQSYTPPRITDLNVYRSDESDQPDDNGTNLHFGLMYESDKGVATSITWQWKTPTDSDWIGSRSTPDANSDGIVNTSTIYDSSQKNTIDPEKTYIVCITVTDSGGSTVKLVSIPGQIFPIDVKSGGKGVSFGKAAEEEGLCDIGFQTKFTGGIKNEILTKATDLDDLTIPNTYVGINNVDYTNQPPGLTGTFTLEVMSAGDTEQVMQRITRCGKDNPCEWVRHCHKDAGSDEYTWGSWIGGNTIIWSGAFYMQDLADSEPQTVELKKGTELMPISSQANGIVLVFSTYDNTNKKALDEDFVTHFVSKHVVSVMPGKNHVFPMYNAWFNKVACKSIKIYDDKLEGTSFNTDANTNGSRIFDYNNKEWVLRYVIGV